MAEPTVVEFERVIKTLTLRTGWKSIKASFTYLVCGTCGAMVYDDIENKQKHANFHGEVERHTRDLHAHTRDFLHQVSGPIA